MHLLERVAGDVEVLLRSDDVNFFSIVESFADEGDVLETEESNVASHELIGAAEGVLGLPVEGTLPEDRAKEAVVFQEGLDVVDDLHLGLGGRANNDYVAVGDDVLSAARAPIDAPCHLAFVLPVGLGGVGNDLITKKFGTTRQNVDLPLGVEMADHGD